LISSKDLKITTLVENTAGAGNLMAEWGLSMLIEAGERSILLDTGAGLGNALLHNARLLRADLDSLDTIVLSHAHYDHTGGLRQLLSSLKQKEIPVVAHPHVWDLKYSRNKKTGKYTYSGIPFRREELERQGARFELSAGPTWLTEDIAVSGEEPQTTAFEKVAEGFFVKTESGYEPDPFPDDQSVYIRTELGLVILLGCAHRGMVNIIRHAQKLMGEDKIHMVLGGTHLGPADDKQAEETIGALKEMNFDWLGVSHCTGLPVAARLSEAFGGRFFFNNAGRRIRFPFSP